MTEASPHQQLDGMITGYRISQEIYAAAKFGIADHLKYGPRSVDELAEATSTNADSLYRLLRALLIQRRHVPSICRVRIRSCASGTACTRPASRPCWQSVWSKRESVLLAF